VHITTIIEHVATTLARDNTKKEVNR